MGFAAEQIDGPVTHSAPEQFTRLMREGVPLDGRDLGVLGGASRGRFSNFTDEEIAPLHAYLRERARK